ncbi:MAG: hypothetical protein EU539_10025 [Promethearchaeota archaeon]|nr:MAG: hypothetical protein EU539_10025 [Candidatus Lokiarchaeota archaeon]
MIDNEKKLWDKLRKFYLFKMEQRVEKEKKKLDFYAENIGGKFVKKKGYTQKGSIHRIVESFYSPFWISPHFLNFTYGINRVMTFYTKLIKIKTPEDLVSYQNALYYDTSLLFLINALENYLISTFRFLAKGINISFMNKNHLHRFIKEFNIEKKFFKRLEKFNTLEFPFSELTPERMDIQQKKKCNIAFKLLGINLPELNRKIWEKIFTNESHGYIQRRHKIIHSSYIPEIKNINDIKVKDEITYIERAILDIVEFVHNIEWIRLWLRPDPMEISWVEGVLSESFDHSNFQDFKKIIIKAIEEQKKEASQK